MVFLYHISSVFLALTTASALSLPWTPACAGTQQKHTTSPTLSSPIEITIVSTNMSSLSDLPDWTLPSTAAAEQC